MKEFNIEVQILIDMYCTQLINRTAAACDKESKMYIRRSGSLHTSKEARQLELLRQPSDVPTIAARRQIRRMRGGSQANLMYCSDGDYYVVKFSNNPQHARILVNEFVGTRLAGLLGLPTAPIALVRVSERLIISSNLNIEYMQGRTPCKPGLQFGSRYLACLGNGLINDSLSDQLLALSKNLSDFAGMLVFDKWTCNTDSRQVVFLREPQAACYTAVMIDQGFCFNAGDWNFPDAPLRGLYFRSNVYETVTSARSFEPWLDKLNQITSQDIQNIIGQVPREWSSDWDQLVALGRQLHERRGRVPELIREARLTRRTPFRNWACD